MRKIIILLISIVTLLSISIPASAHPGHTDGAGGHRDSSTDEYHYHHGYSAHDHYDMDGDGDVDCPYNFVDATKKSGSSGISSTITSKTIPIPPTITNKNPSTKVCQVTEEENKVPTWVYWVFAAQAIVSIVLGISNRSMKQDIDRMTYEHKNSLDVMRQSYDRKLAEKSALDNDLQQIRNSISHATSEYKQLYGKLVHERKELEATKQARIRLKNAPLYINFAKDGKPIYWKAHKSKPYGDYTVYMSSGSNVYHTDQYCSGYYSREAHIFDVIDSARPCKKCAEGFFDFTSVPEWYAPPPNFLDDASLKLNWRD